MTLWTLLALRWLARVERRRAAIVLGAPIDERYRPGPPDDGRRWTARLHDLMGEPAIWRDFAWAALWGCSRTGRLEPRGRLWVRSSA